MAEKYIPKWGEAFFFFFFFFFRFSKPLKFVLGPPKWKFSTGKKYFMPKKKNRKNDFAPSENFSCYTPGMSERPPPHPNSMFRE